MWGNKCANPVYFKVLPVEKKGRHKREKVKRFARIMREWIIAIRETRVVRGGGRETKTKKKKEKEEDGT